MTKEEHIERHKLLHNHFDELFADFITHNENKGIDNTIWELMEWSYQQTMDPVENPNAK